MTALLVSGSLLLLAFTAFKAGYSLALGAFLFGVVVSETRQRGKIERGFQGLKDVFLTVFFVTIGMLIDVSAIPSALLWIGLGTAGALIGRTSAACFVLIIFGEHPRDALRAALCLTPIGEFSFIIAGIGVASGLFSETFQVAAVGVSLATCIIGWQFLAGLIVVFILAALIAWRPIILWQSHFESALNSALQEADSDRSKALESMRRAGRWNYELEEIVLPDDTAYAGLPLAECALRSDTGTSIVGIERNEFTLSTIAPGIQIFPGDHLLLLGSREQLNRAREKLLGRRQTGDAGQQLADLSIDTFTVSKDASSIGKSLVELDLSRRFQLQIVALRRSNGEELHPEADTIIRPGDQLLLVGRSDAVKKLAQAELL